MAYIKNNCEMGISLRVGKGAFKKKFEFHARRFFADTGNVAQSGVVEVTDEELKALKEDLMFSKLIKRRTLEVVSDADAISLGKKDAEADEALVKRADAAEARLKELEKRLSDAESAKSALAEENKKLNEAVVALSDASGINLKAEIERADAKGSKKDKK